MRKGCSRCAYGQYSSDHNIRHDRGREMCRRTLRRVRERLGVNIIKIYCVYVRSCQRGDCQHVYVAALLERYQVSSGEIPRG